MNGGGRPALVTHWTLRGRIALRTCLHLEGRACCRPECAKQEKTVYAQCTQRLVLETSFVCAGVNQDWSKGDAIGVSPILTTIGDELQWRQDQSSSISERMT